MQLAISALVLCILAAGSVVAVGSGNPSAFASGHSPRKVFRKPDQFWDHVVKGAEAEKLSKRDAEGGRIQGELANYTLRVKEADRDTLGIDTVKQYSGYLDNNEQDKHLFYWFFESRNDPANDPVVLWLNGGPGCSSVADVLSGLGPSGTPTRDLQPSQNPHAWNNNASVIFLDQPVGTGFSYSSRNVSTTNAASNDVYALLTLFFNEFPQYAKQDFHIAGVSYAGHYIPIFSQNILAHKDRNINLKSVLIWNGITDPLTQYQYYKPMACGDGGYSSSLNQTECQGLVDVLPRCQSLIKSCYDSDNSDTCANATRTCNEGLLEPYQRNGGDLHDVRKRTGEERPIDYAEKYLNEAHVKDALGVEVGDFKRCNDRIFDNFVSTGDVMKPTFRVVPELLEQISVLVYAGDADYICNWLGNRAWTNALEWRGRDAFNEAEEVELRSATRQTSYGTMKTAQNFAFLQVHQAGHIVPLRLDDLDAFGALK